MFSLSCFDIYILRGVNTASMCGLIQGGVNYIVDFRETDTSLQHIYFD